ncbi:mitochondrial ubiquitin ligase activator of nfkb 1-A [Amia ocellicauda]|uniref:mitochondrial ubiquitin ligase activator of nfkb 1-A n=1 Tax=Amia ocellicauda TaxID=2972642 RepID=UPI0034642FE3|nr:MUL1A ligase [Amia calva]
MEGIPFRTLELVWLGSSVAFSGLFYYIYRRKRKTVDKLKEVPSVPLDEHLAGILNAVPGKCLQYVVIEGTVQPVGEPLRSQFQEGSLGVVQRLVLKEHKLVWNNLARTWTDSERTLHQRVNTVPFDLVGWDRAAVRVLSPLEASGLEMETVHEKFHQASFGFTDIISQYLSGEKPKGQLETEEMLRVGATLTGVGELILDSDRVLKLRPPADGSEYFLTTSDFQTMLAEQEGQATVWRVLMSVCVVAGVAAVLWLARKYYIHLQAKWEMEELRRQFERLDASRTAAPGETEDPELLENACVICLTNPRSCVLLECGHVCCCFSCFQALPVPTCPICRRDIVRVVPLYQA